MIREYFLENFNHLKRDLTQEQVASLSGIPRGRISAWVSRKTVPTPEDIEALAVAFDVEPYYFFMRPGTQGSTRPVKREDSFEVLMDELAEKYLEETDRAAYTHAGGAGTFIKIMRLNFETDETRSADWYERLSGILAQYAGLDLIEKMRNRAKEKVTPQKKGEIA